MLNPEQIQTLADNEIIEIARSYDVNKEYLSNICKECGQVWCHPASRECRVLASCSEHSQLDSETRRIRYVGRCGVLLSRS